MKAEKLMILDFLESYQKRMAEIAKAIWEYAELGLHRTYQTPFQGLSSKILPPSGGWKGVTDSSEPSWFAPYGVARVACRPPGIPAHSWGACASYGSTMGLKGMMTAAKALGLSAVDLLTTPGILEDAQKEFQEKLKGRTYSPLIPPDQKPPVP